MFFGITVFYDGYDLDMLLVRVITYVPVVLSFTPGAAFCPNQESTIQGLFSVFKQEANYTEVATVRTSVICTSI